MGTYSRIGMYDGFEQRSYLLCFSKQEIFTYSDAKEKIKKCSYWLACFFDKPWFSCLIVTRNLVFFLSSWYLCFSVQYKKNALVLETT